jgi:hypothetical protein
MIHHQVCGPMLFARRPIARMAWRHEVLPSRLPYEDTHSYRDCANHEFGPFMACMSSAQRVGGRHRNRIQAAKANIPGVSKRSESKRTKPEENVGEVRWDIGMRWADGGLLEDLVSPAPNVPPLQATPLETARNPYSLLDPA